MGRALRAQQQEIVGGAGVFTIGGAHEAADRQIEAGRTIPPLVLPIEDKRPNAVRNVFVTITNREKLLHERHQAMGQHVQRVGRPITLACQTKLLLNQSATAGRRRSFPG
jgi:hypothetical protein